MFASLLVSSKDIHFTAKWCYATWSSSEKGKASKWRGLKKLPKYKGGPKEIFPRRDQKVKGGAGAPKDSKLKRWTRKDSR